MPRLGFACMYRDAAFQALMAERFAAIGTLARDQDLRLSFHPGQYCVLGSDR
jgi:UV DNA damage endonuclease